MVFFCLWPRDWYANQDSTNLEESGRETYGFLTKGDNSPLDDTVLYPLTQRYLYRSDIVGSVKGYIPYLGQLALLLSEFLWLKYAILVISALSFVYEFR